MPHHKRPSPLLILTLILSLLFAQPALAQTDADPPVVRAVLFYSPACPHCHQVIQENLPPLIEKYGDQLLIVGINTQSIEGQELYQAMVEHFELPDERLGVPALVVGETHLVGSAEIPQLFPTIVEEGLAAGGIPWPPIPGFVEVYTTSVAQATAQAESEIAADPLPGDQPAEQSQAGSPQSTAATPLITPQAELAPVQMDIPETQSVAEKFRRDPVGNTASVVVLFAMLLSLIGVWRRLQRPPDSPNKWGRWAILLLSVIGLVVAGYLSYVETTQSQAVCGPVGDCNAVQQSPYARLFGVLPVGVLGLLGYAAILAAWAVHYYADPRWREWAAHALWGFALFGTLFSIYLTFLEPFIIGATCAWCLTSAVIITLILWAATDSLRPEESS